MYKDATILTYMDQRFYSADELAKLYNVSTRTVNNWAKLGKVTYKKIGKRYFFPKEEHEPKSTV